MNSTITKELAEALAELVAVGGRTLADNNQIQHLRLKAHNALTNYRAELVRIAKIEEAARKAQTAYAVESLGDIAPWTIVRLGDDTFHCLNGITNVRGPSRKTYDEASADVSVLRPLSIPDGTFIDSITTDGPFTVISEKIVGEPLTEESAAKEVLNRIWPGDWSASRAGVEAMIDTFSREQLRHLFSQLPPSICAQPGSLTRDLTPARGAAKNFLRMGLLTRGDVSHVVRTTKH